MTVTGSAAQTDEPIDEPETSKDRWLMVAHPLGPGYRGRSSDQAAIEFHVIATANPEFASVCAARYNCSHGGIDDSRSNAQRT